MEREISVSQARSTIRNFLRLFSNRNSRIHSNAAEDTVNRLRSLDGICGNCKNVILKGKHQDGKAVVVVGCAKRHSPLNLYRDTELGKIAFCKDFNENS